MFMCSGQLFSHGESARSSHTPARQRLARMWSSNSWRKCRMRGQHRSSARVWPSPQSEVSRIIRPSSSSRSRSASRPSPLVMRVQDAQRLVQPHAARHALAAGFRVGELDEVAGDVHHAVVFVHHHHAARAHDGAELAPASRSPPGVSNISCGMQPPEGPPVCTALTCWPSHAAAADVVDERLERRAQRHLDQAGVRAPCRPARRPWCRRSWLLPVSVNHAGPLVTIGAMLYQVSTLLMLVGLPHRPFCAGNGGRGRGAARRVLPAKRSARSLRRRRRRRRPRPVRYRSRSRGPGCSSPSTPYSRACSMARLSRCTASGYSART